MEYTTPIMVSLTDVDHKIGIATVQKNCVFYAEKYVAYTKHNLKSLVMMASVSVTMAANVYMTPYKSFIKIPPRKLLDTSSSLSLSE